MDKKFITTEQDSPKGRLIIIIGIGGGGNNAVESMYDEGIAGVNFIVCDTDGQALSGSNVPNKIRIGANTTGVPNSKCKPEAGRQAAMESIEEIKDTLLRNNPVMVIIAAGLGGGVGTGATPVIARAAKEMGLFTIAIVTLPFKDEGEEAYERAMNGLQNLRNNVDSILVINSRKLCDINQDISMLDNIVATAAKSIAKLITINGGYISVDFADLKEVMSNSDMALIGMGRGAGENRVNEIAEQALNSPLLNDISEAKNILVHISTGLKNPLLIREFKELMGYITEASGNKPNLIRGISQDETLDETSDAEIAITIIATGFSINKLFPDIDIDEINHEQKKD
jgi:cell division protein FtsZ